MIRLISFVAFVLLAPVLSLAEEPPKRPANPYAAVAAAELFAVGGVGFAGTVTEAETSLRKIVKQPDGAELCRKLLGEKNRAAQLYGLFGLKIVDSGAFAEAYPKFEKSKAKVKTASGCCLYDESVAALAKEIKDGTLK